MSKLRMPEPEVITLMSSDEESPSLEEIKNIEKSVIVKIEETSKPRVGARKSIQNGMNKSRDINSSFKSDLINSSSLSSKSKNSTLLKPVDLGKNLPNNSNKIFTNNETNKSIKDFFACHSGAPTTKYNSVLSFQSSNSNNDATISKNLQINSDTVDSYSAKSKCTARKSIYSSSQIRTNNLPLQAKKKTEFINNDNITTLSKEHDFERKGITVTHVNDSHKDNTSTFNPALQSDSVSKVIDGNTNIKSCVTSKQCITGDKFDSNKIHNKTNSILEPTSDIIYKTAFQSSINTNLNKREFLNYEKKELPNQFNKSASKKRQMHYDKSAILNPSKKSIIARPDLGMISISSNGTAYLSEIRPFAEKTVKTSENIIFNESNILRKVLENPLLNENSLKSMDSFEELDKNSGVNKTGEKQKELLIKFDLTNLQNRTKKSLEEIMSNSDLKEQVSGFIGDSTKGNLNGQSEKLSTAPKQVTSPKLSLKRKREDPNNDLMNAKKGLFADPPNCVNPSHYAENSKLCNKTGEANTSHLKGSITTTSELFSKHSDTLSESHELKSDFNNGNIPEHHNPIKNNLPGPSSQRTTLEFKEFNKKKFEMLLEFCISKLNFSVKEESKMRDVMNSKLSRANEAYASSLEFSNLLDTIWEKVKNNSNKICTYLRDLKEELKAFKTKSVSKQPDFIPPSVSCSSDSVKSFELKPCVSTALLHDDTVVSSIKKSEFLASSGLVEKRSETAFKANDLNSKTVNSIKQVSVPKSNHKAVLSNEEAKAELDKKIKECEELMGKLDKKIKKLQETELSLDDLNDEDSSYLKEDLYKRKLNRMWATLCRYKNRSSRLGSEFDKRFYFTGTRYKEINQKVEKFINKRKKEMPNYVEIYNLVKSTGIEVGLKEFEYASLAEDIFKEVGLEIKRRRIKDEESTFGCFLTDSINLNEDPAEKDDELKHKLQHSAKEGERKIDEIINKYAAMTESDLKDEEEAEKDSDVSLEPEYNERNDDLPDTDPATPVSEPTLPLRSEPKKDCAIIDIASDSDATTDPGSPSKVENFPVTMSSELNMSKSTELPAGESDSSSLPSL